MYISRENSRERERERERERDDNNCKTFTRPSIYWKTSNVSQGNSEECLKKSVQ